MQTETIPVLIVGGSLVGLSSAMFLALRGVPAIVVERHAGSSPHPRAIGYTQRTMELFAYAGIISQVPQAPPTFRLRRAEVESLAGKWKEDTLWTPGKEEKSPAPEIEYSPYTGAAIAQDKLEPILRSRATELVADLRYSTEMISYEQDEHGITALVRERNGGKEYTIKAAYMIAADGSKSSVREKLGIARKGMGHLNTVRSVLFRAPLEEYLKSGVHQFEIDQPDLKAFLTTYKDGRWVLMFTDDQERDEAEQRAAIYKAIGREDIDVEIITTGRWELDAEIADKFSFRRIFIAGDSAHTLPPTRGGFGANTGIADAHNLAWKLAAVLSGASTPELLETYSIERQPVAWERHQQTFARPDFEQYIKDKTQNISIIDDAAMEFGQLYRSEAIIGAGAELPVALLPNEWHGQPGTRAPHVWVSKDGAKVSTLDFLQHDWVLFAADDQWKAAAKTAGEKLKIELKCLRIGSDFVPEDREAFLTAFGLQKTGATLIRPDGFIAWRSAGLPTDPEGTLTAAFGKVSFAKANENIQ